VARAAAPAARAAGRPAEGRGVRGGSGGEGGGAEAGGDDPPDHSAAGGARGRCVTGLVHGNMLIIAVGLN